MMEKIKFMYFWLHYSDGNNHIEKIHAAVKDIDHLFSMAKESIESEKVHLFLLSDGTQISDNEYLESLENSTELIISKVNQMGKLSIYFHIKRYLQFKNISSRVNIDILHLLLGLLL